MPVTELVVKVDVQNAQRLSDAMLAAGALSVDLEDAQFVPSAKNAGDEPADPNAWVQVRLTALLHSDDSAVQLLGDACRLCGLQPPAHESRVLADEDWVGRSQRQFPPIHASERVWIVPSWHEAPDPNAVNIELDPGMAFGTGSHPSTRLCLRWLDANVTGGESLLDYGCGSGILAIVGMKLGARVAFGVDIDPEALIAARANAARNGVHAVFCGAGAPLEVAADLVVSNILANPLKVLAPLLAHHCRGSGRLALSGILQSQASEVREAYRPWFTLDKWGEEDDWVCLAGARR